jgi:hypothetical protein
MKLLTKLAITVAGYALLLAYSAPVFAACTITNAGPLQFYSNCHADNQANDGDDIKMFVDKTPRTTAVIDGSLGKNDQTFNNVVATTNADFETDGSGFANFKSVDAGSKSNTLTAYVFANGPSTTLPDGTPFNGFDGQLFRGQIDNTGTGGATFNGELFVLVTLKDGTNIPFLYSGLSDKNDFGVLGFDERPGVDEMVRSVFISVNDPNETNASGLNPLCVACGPANGAFNEFKQIEFSVPGAVAAIPEPQTWAMMLIGFAMVGFVAWRNDRLHAWGMRP